MTTQVVKFNDAEIVCIIGEFGKIDVVIKPICDQLGLDSDRQIKTISEDEVLGAERSEHTVQLPKNDKNWGAERSEQTVQVSPESQNNGADPSEQSRKMVCLPLEFLNGWLFQIKFTNTMSDDTKAKLVDYKRKCYKALFAHFFGKMKHQIESNKIEIELLEQLAKYNEEKSVLAENIKKTQKQIAQIRDERLKNEPTLF